MNDAKTQFEKRFPKPIFNKDNCPEFDMYVIEDWERHREGWLEGVKWAIEQYKYEDGSNNIKDEIEALEK